MLQFFKNQNAGAFAHHEAVAVLVPGTAGASGIVVASGKRAHGGESADAHGGNGGFGAPSNHYVGIMVLDDAEGIADGVGAGGAGGGRRFIRALGAEAHGDVTGGEVDDGGGNEEKRDPARGPFHKRGVFSPGPPASAPAPAHVTPPRPRLFAPAL